MFGITLRILIMNILFVQCSQRQAIIDSIIKNPTIEVSGRKITFELASENETSGNLFKCLRVRNESLDEFTVNLLESFSSMSMDFKTASGRVKLDQLNTVLFIGKTGAGKSTLVQLLSGNNHSKLTSVETGEGTRDYVIVDGDKIGKPNDVLTSKTLYPDLLLDNETDVVLCDNPGFEDTRSPNHELIAALAMREVAISSKKIKISLVVDHSSLRTGMYREEFTNMLEQLTEFVINVDKYLDSTSLIATKVDNRYRYVFDGEVGKMALVPDSIMITDVAEFLLSVRDSYQEKFNKEGNSHHLKIVKILNSILKVNESTGEYQRIGIVRKPDKPGPVAGISMLQLERSSIRQLLFSLENFVSVRKEDFGLTVSDNAKLNLDNLHQTLDNYVTKQSDMLSAFLEIHYSNEFNMHDNDISSTIKKRERVFGLISTLFNNVGKCTKPEEYTKVIKDFLDSNNLPYCQNFLTNILFLNRYVVNAKSLLRKTIFSYGNWQQGLQPIVKKVENELLYQKMLLSAYSKLREYDVQRKRTSVLKQGRLHNLFYADYELRNIMEKIGLSNYNQLLINNKLRKDEFDKIVLQNLLKYKTKVVEEKGSLILIDSIVLLSELRVYLPRFQNSEIVIVMAADTIYIDTDIEMRGKSLMLVAPRLVVTGKHMLFLNGEAPEPKLPDASWGQVGLDGRDGAEGGSFLAVASEFIGMGDLTVNVKGGDGSPGQNGGAGRDGYNGYHRENGDNGGKVFLLYNSEWEETYIIGYPGSAGGNSGAGGYGGRGGKAGSAQLISLMGDTPALNLLTGEGREGPQGSAGKPGRGGINFCNGKRTYVKRYLLFFNVYSKDVTEYSSCNKENPDGVINKSRRFNSNFSKKKPSLPVGAICSVFKQLKLFVFETNFLSKLTSERFKLFEESVKKLSGSFGC